MENQTSFTVVVTSYNYKRFVSEAVQSALGQTRPAHQIIVVDDGSTDGSAALLQEHFGGDPRVTLLLGKNRGQLSAFKRGIAPATGSVVCFLDADDRWRPDYLAKIGAIYDSRPEVDFVFTALQLFDRESGALRYADRDVDYGYTAILVYMMAYWYGAPTSALSLRTPWAQRALDLPESFDHVWKIAADNCLVYGASVLGARKYYLDTGGSVEYRVHGANNWRFTNGSNPESPYLQAMKRRTLIEHYAKTIGLSKAHTRYPYLKKEFLTKEDPTWKEAARYANAPAWKKRGNGFSPLSALKTWKLYRRRQRRA